MRHEGKIFCVGLPKTGTTSLAEYLARLGYYTWHFSGIYAGPILKIMKERRVKHPFFHMFDAFADHPAFSMYLDLNQAWPGAKFILTTRKMDEWLESVKRMFCRSRRCHYGEMRELHRFLYGVDAYDRAKMAAFFLRHCETVIRNLSDLLIVDVDDPKKGEIIAKYLGKTGVLPEYPHMNAKRGLREN